MKSFCIIGLGSFGQTLADTLARSGRQVMVIDSDPQRVNLLADYVTDAVIGDPTNENVLKNSGVRNYDCAVNCLNENLNDSIIVTVILKEMGIKQVVARAGSQRHKYVLEKLGADMVVFPEHDMGEKLAELLVRKNVLDYIDLYEDYCIAKIDVPKSWIGKSLLQLDLRRKQGINIVAVHDMSGKTTVAPDPTMLFSQGDEVSVMGVHAAVDRLTGKL